MPNRLYPTIKARGCTAPSGKKFIILRQHGQEWLVPYQAIVTDLPGTLRVLGEQGLAVGGQGYAAEVGEQISEVDRFPQMEVLEHPGWNGPLFARPDGVVFAPRTTADSARPAIGYYRFASRQRRTGKPSDWKRKIAPVLVKHDIATFLLGVALAPVIRELSSRTRAPASFDIVVAHKTGAVRRVLLSTIGSMTSSSLATDPLDRVLARPAHYAEATRDGLLVLGDVEGHLHGGADRKRSTALRALFFDHLTATDAGEINASGALVPAFVTVENRPLAEVLGLDSAATERLRQMVPTIRVRADTFDARDADNMVAGVGERAWANVLREMGDCYGHELFAFQRKLVQRRFKKGPVQVQAELNGAFDAFCTHAARRFVAEELAETVVHIFALVYAAVHMAGRLKVLPVMSQERLAIWRTFEQFVADRPRPVTAASILAEVAAKPGVRNVDEVGEADGKAELEEVPAFIKTSVTGRRELWVLTARKKETFDWPFFSKLPDFSQWYCGKGEKDRQGSKKVIGGWKDARVLRFRLP